MEITAENIQVFLEQKNSKISMEKAQSICSSILSELTTLQNALQSASLPNVITFEDIDMVSNEVSWKIKYTISSSSFIN